MPTRPLAPIAPDADRKSAAQLATRGLVTNAEQTCAQHMQLGLTHPALEIKQKSIVEHRSMIGTVDIGDQRVRDAAEIEQAITTVGTMGGW